MFHHQGVMSCPLLWTVVVNLTRFILTAFLPESFVHHSDILTVLFAGHPLSAGGIRDATKGDFRSIIVKVLILPKTFSLNLCSILLVALRCGLWCSGRAGGLSRCGSGFPVGHWDCGAYGRADCEPCVKLLLIGMAEVSFSSALGSCVTFIFLTAGATLGAGKMYLVLYYL